MIIILSFMMLNVCSAIRSCEQWRKDQGGPLKRESALRGIWVAPIMGTEMFIR